MAKLWKICETSKHFPKKFHTKGDALCRSDFINRLSPTGNDGIMFRSRILMLIRKILMVRNKILMVRIPEISIRIFVISLLVGCTAGVLFYRAKTLYIANKVFGLHPLHPQHPPWVSRVLWV